ncbi:MAG: hypothetical protein U9N10_04565, partial [Bacillota bacterium]|nr:hypothetical protein [Bacillota bacterium]
INAKIVFVRDRNNSKKWIAIISTDLELTEEEIIASYGKRWSIMLISALYSLCRYFKNADI